MPRGETVAAKWRRWLKVLREGHPTEYPVKVRRVPLRDRGEDVHGDCDLIEGKHGRYFRIRIDTRLSTEHAFYILLHEWAHALTWDQSDIHDHGDAWGTTYAELWREYVGDGDFEAPA